ncbi:MAG: class I SAM-dependent methyltransferase [Spirochaetota bacterium]
MAKVSAIDPALRDYIVSVSVKECDSLKSVREKTASHPCAKQQIPPEEGQLLAMLVRISGARRILEIGSFTGYSALAMALALPSGGKITAVDKNPEWTSRALKSWEEAGVGEKISLLVGDGIDVLDRLIAEEGAGAYDFAFIDADKKSYAAYFDRSMTLVKKGGIIAIDNTLWRTTLGHEEMHFFNCDAMREFNEKIFADSRVDLSILPVADGLTIAYIKD